jgi:hypothetical protein
MIAVTIWIVWAAFNKHGRPPMVPLWAHATALAFVAVEIASRAIKIQWGARAVSVHVSFWTAVRTCLGGDLASCLTPSRTGAEPARFLVLAEMRMPPANILIVLFIELTMELTSLIAVGLGLWLIFDGSRALLGILGTIIATYTAFFLTVTTAGLLVTKQRAAGPAPAWSRSLGINADRWRRIQRSLGHIRESMTALKSARLSWLLAAFTASLIHVLARLAVLPAIVWSVDRVAHLSSLLMWPLVLIYGGSMAPAPGGGGAVEFGFNKAFGGELAPSLLAASMIWWRFYTFYLYIVLGALAGGSTVLRALRPRPSLTEA